MNISVIVLFGVFMLIAVRRVGNFHFGLWQIMLLGAVAVLVMGQIGPRQALHAIDLDVMLFLFGVFVVGQALEESGYLFHLSYKLFRRAGTANVLILLILFGVGIASAFLMNDTLAIIGTPLVLLLAKQHRMPPKVLLLALAFAVTLGSVMSPIGNPQNLLISIHGRMDNPFVEFFRHLALPTAINLLAAFFILKLFYRESFHGEALVHTREDLRDPRLARLARLSLILIIVLVCLKVALVFTLPRVNFRLTWIALIAAAPILLFSTKRFSILRHSDWRTLVFFAAMFVLMESVWDSGYFQSLMAQWNLEIHSMGAIFGVSVLLSQLISNVPLVALYMPILMHTGASTPELLALAAGSTIAGNLFILGAASNIIIIQNAERKTGHTLGFVEFARVGIPLTLVNVLVYWFFLT
ncbi:MAG: anion transporter [Gammaproteobacteria bacterium]|nr:anion transporter [Gammaproteobacteria bacterium]